MEQWKSIRINAELYDKIKELAKKNKRSLRSMAEWLIETGIKRAEFQAKLAELNDYFTEVLAQMKWKRLELAPMLAEVLKKEIDRCPSCGASLDGIKTRIAVQLKELARLERDARIKESKTSEKADEKLQD